MVPFRKPSAIALMVVAASCGRIVGVDDYAVSGTGPRRCAGFGAPECAACLETSCCDQLEACGNDPACAPFEACLSHCGPEAGSCRFACYRDHPKERTPRAAELIGCLVRGCPSCVGCGTLQAPAGEGCERCIADDSAACGVTAECIADQECRAWHACLIERCQSWETDPGCRAACWKEHPDGNETFFTLARTLGGCTGSCRWGEHWSCLDRTLDWPNHDSDAKARVTLKSGPPNEMVRACPIVPEDCIDGSFNEDGIATLELPESPREYPWVYRVPGSSAAQRPATLHVYATPTIGIQYRTLAQATTPPPIPVEFDPSLGAVIALTADCLGSFSATSNQPTGVEFELSSPASGPFYGINPASGAADGYQAVFLDVPGTSVTVTAYHRAGNERQRIDSIAVPVESGALTVVSFFLPAVYQ